MSKQGPAARVAKLAEDLKKKTAGVDANALKTAADGTDKLASAAKDLAKTLKDED